MLSDTLGELVSVAHACSDIEAPVQQGLEWIATALAAGRKVLTCGNGGSAADAFHLAEELIGRYQRNRRPLPAICLNSDATALTCIANDFGYTEIFSRQVQGLGNAGDILVAFTTSGNSENVLAALKAAQTAQLRTITLTGQRGGVARTLSELVIQVPSNNTARIQEIHTVILHHWLEAIDAIDW